MSFLTERYGPLPGWGWGIAGGGALVVTFIVLRSKSSSSSQPQSANLNTSGGPTTGDLLGSTPAGQGTSLFNGADSIMSVLQGIESQLANTQAQIPPQPGSTTPKPLPGVPDMPFDPNSPNGIQLPSFLAGTGLTNVSGRVVGWALQPGGGVDFATDTGAVYTEGGAQYYGGTNPGSIGAGYNAGQIVGIQALQGGGYSLINAKGQTYNFTKPL